MRQATPPGRLPVGTRHSAHRAPDFRTPRPQCQARPDRVSHLIVASHQHFPISNHQKKHPQPQRLPQFSPFLIIPRPSKMSPPILTLGPSKPPNPPPKATAHLLPCRVHHNGSIEPIQPFWKPEKQAGMFPSPSPPPPIPPPNPGLIPRTPRRLLNVLLPRPQTPRNPPPAPHRLPRRRGRFHPPTLQRRRTRHPPLTRARGHRPRRPKPRETRAAARETRRASGIRRGAGVGTRGGGRDGRGGRGVREGDGGVDFVGGGDTWLCEAGGGGEVR